MINGQPPSGDPVINGQQPGGTHVNRRTVPVPAASGPEFVPSSPELRSDTPRVGTHEAVTVATPPFPSGEVTPGFEPCPPQNVAVCPACLDPVLPEGAGPATACHWPVCGHSYHALCLARSRAHVQRMQCALCRQGWRPAFDSDLEALCGQLGIDWHALQLHDPVPVQPAPSAGVASDDADVAIAPAAPELDAFVTSAPVAPATLVEPAPPPAVGPHTWTAARPPLAGGQVPPVNSWFFVPLLLAGGGCRRRPFAPKCRTPMVSSSRSRRRLAGGCVSTPSFSAGASVSVPVCP